MNYAFVFILGMIAGSFLNVVILRYNTGQSALKGSSMCFNCGKNLKWYELIPVFSFIFQKGKCRRCGSKISWQYPIVEIITGLLFLLIFNFQFSIFSKFSPHFLLSTIYYLVIFSLLIIIAFYDLRHKIIPNEFVYAFDIMAFLSLFGILDFKFGISEDFLNRFLVGIGFFAFFAAIWLLSRGRGMGFGDAKLALGIGWLLGWPKGFYALLVSFWLGALVGIFLVFFYKKSYNMKSSIPFGPFLVLGALLAFFISINIYI